jgi:phosphoesterase RecJ-like protein
MTGPATAFSAAARAIADAESVVAVGHINPDGDALGSALAIAIACRAAGKQAWASFGDPFVLPETFRYLDLEAVASPGEIEGDIDVLVACDTANPERLGSALHLAERAGTVVIVDHHVSNAGFGDIAVVEPTAAATAQLVFGLLVDHLAWPLSPEVATALYTGLVTDTGRFQYSSTTPEVHRVAAALLGAGADPDLVARHVYGEAPFGYLAVAGAVLGRAVLERDARMIWSTVYLEDLERAGVGYEETDGLIDLIRLATEAEVACLLKETGSGAFKGSLRSRGLIDVNAVAGHFGGGGHHNAAGFTAETDLPDLVAELKGLLA